MTGEEITGVLAPHFGHCTIWTPIVSDTTPLSMNGRHDADEVFVQRPGVNIDPFRDDGSYIHHKAMLDRLPTVASFLCALEDGAAKPMDRSRVRPGSIRTAGITDPEGGAAGPKVKYGKYGTTDPRNPVPR